MTTLLEQAQIALALQIAVEAHADQRYGGTLPYIQHVLGVAEQMHTPTTVMAALLHDVLEDQGDRYSATSLLARGIPRRVVDLVALLSRRPGEEYDAYIGRVTTDPDAIRVKLGDARYHLQYTNPRTEKYGPIVEWLEEILHGIDEHDPMLHGGR